MISSVHKAVETEQNERTNCTIIKTNVRNQPRRNKKQYELDLHQKRTLSLYHDTCTLQGLQQAKSGPVFALATVAQTNCSRHFLPMRLQKIPMEHLVELEVDALGKQDWEFRTVATPANCRPHRARQQVQQLQDPKQ
jgi:hypothetical protein